MMLRVFLVDADAAARSALRAALNWAELGFELVGEAADGEEALPLLRALRPELVITDICLPKMDGLALCRRLRAEFPQTHFAIVSACEDFSRAREAIGLGVRAYLTKPVDAAALREALIQFASELDAPEECEFAPLLGQELMPLEELLRYAAPGDARNILLHRAEALGAPNSRLLSDYLCADALLTAARIVRDCRGDLREVAPEVLGMAQDGDMLGHCADILRKALEFRDARIPARHGIVIRRALAYMDENFANPGLTLKAVAAHVALSNNHFCTVFSREMGVTFSEYLTDLRIRRAKELLRSSRLHTGEIADAVGYNDPHYFSKLFKQLTGLTPRDFRRAQDAESGTNRKNQKIGRMETEIANRKITHIIEENNLFSCD